MTLEGCTIIVSLTPPVFHIYTVPPEAVMVSATPLHVAFLPVKVITGYALTVTTTVCAALLHPLADKPVTVYVVVFAGFAVTTESVVELKFVLGVHTYVAVPLHVNTEESPRHIDVGLANAVITGVGFTITTTVSVALQPLATEPVSVYVCVVVGFAITDVPVVALKPVAGAHVYVVAPLPDRVVVSPAHITVLVAETITVGLEFTVTVTVCTALLHPAEVPVTEYVIVLAGLAVIEDPVVALKLVLGDHW